MILLVALIVMAVIGFFVGLFLGVIVGQRILQRHMFLLQKKQLVEEFQVADLSPYNVSSSPSHVNNEGSIYDAIPMAPPPALHPDDASHLRKLGLLVDNEE